MATLAPTLMPSQLPTAATTSSPSISPTHLPTDEACPTDDLGCDQATMAEKALLSLGHKPELPTDNQMDIEKPEDLHVEIDLGAEQDAKTPVAVPSG